MQNFEARATLIVIAFLAFMVSMAFPPALFVAIPAALLLRKNVCGRVKEIRAAETARIDKQAAKERERAVAVFR